MQPYVGSCSRIANGAGLTSCHAISPIPSLHGVPRHLRSQVRLPRTVSFVSPLRSPYSMGMMVMPMPMGSMTSMGGGCAMPMPMPMPMSSMMPMSMMGSCMPMGGMGMGGCGNGMFYHMRCGVQERSSTLLSRNSVIGMNGMGMGMMSPMMCMNVRLV